MSKEGSVEGNPSCDGACFDLIKILLIEDDLAEARLLQEILKSFDLKSFSLVHVTRLRAAFELLSQKQFDVVLLDLTLPDSQGLASVKDLVNRAPHLPIVVLTNTNDDRLAIEAVRQGAQDYLVKRQVNIDVLVRSLHYAIERQRASDCLRQANQNLSTQMQHQTAELSRVKEINQLKSELVSMFSHDFRNPLTTVLSCAEILKNQSDRLSEEKKDALFRMMSNASRNMAQLLDEVLLVGRTDSSIFECNLTQLDLVAFCRQLVEEIQLSADQKEIKVVFINRGKLNQAVWDENLLQHILGNLLSNAVKYSSPGSQVQLILIGEEDQATLKVRDSGIGIPLEDQKHLFEPFYRASNVGKIPGTGLGLAIAKSCLEPYHGQIEVKSEVGIGTTFTVTLPLIKLIQQDK